MKGKTNAGNGPGAAVGANVWVKSSGKIGIVTTVTAEGSLPTYTSSQVTFKVISSNSEYPMSELTDADLVGLRVYINYTSTSVKDHDVTLLENGVASVKLGSDSAKTYSWTFNPNTGEVTYNKGMASTPNSIETKVSVDVIKKATIYNYLIHEEPDAYPDGAMHTDGFYYEKLASVESGYTAGLAERIIEAVQQDYRNELAQEVSNA